MLMRRREENTAAMSVQGFVVKQVIGSPEFCQVSLFNDFPHLRTRVLSGLDALPVPSGFGCGNCASKHPPRLQKLALGFYMLCLMVANLASSSL